MTRTFTSLDEVRAAIGEPIGPSAPIIVDQKRIDLFAEASGDHQWIHVDPQRAKDGPYGTTIAHGYLTLSLLPLFGADLIAFDFGSARINYGANKVRFPAPVPSGSALTATVELVDVASKPGSSTVTARYTVIVDGATKPSCIAETLVTIVD
ncbi:Acyl dehydratase [Gordonia malaquae]|uniref:3-hydroxyacyl-thioester dehydratase HtdZ n=1 Tax=Gordonia malaquae NBRC 108250 TaxID=1223542 RepID=M3VGK1_GORML|nr:MaoC family dehydratase [Gordonia malaquae]GAC80984.1 3-hydroxyacyl-thioester dehydratase HtdZ [Gordonia malaquae NBRC 108250]SEE38471.1 Acyl dehydratase [Gordonia malaquae]